MLSDFERSFAQTLIQWYQKNKRDLPWRNTSDPYKIWLSEIILQQTRVNQGLPYYNAFLEKFPDVASLARAEEEEVLRLWQGLGYYSRARNLHNAARTVHEVYNNHFPGNYQELLQLKGVGKYTAAAIASFSFNESVAVVDGNVYRVLARIFGIDKDIRSGDAEKTFRQKANELIKTDQPALFNQAMMEFGATHCTPSDPHCSSCPFTNNCFAYINNKQDQLPVKSKAKQKKKRFFNYFIVENDSHIIMKQRQGQDIWQGLYEFVLEETSRAITPLESNQLTWAEFLRKNGASPVREPVDYKHTLSHQHITATFRHFRTGNKLEDIFQNTGFQILEKDKIKDIPKPVLINKYLHTYFF